MTRVQLLSDLHLEHRPFTLKPEPSADLVVIAGDMGPVNGCFGRIRNVLRNLDGKPALVVLGNHCHYGSTLKSTREQWARLLDQFPNVHLLDDSAGTFNGVRFVGGTLWTDFTLYEPDMSQTEAMRNAYLGITDFRAIRRDDGSLIAPDDLVGWNRRCCDAIEQVVAEGNPTVVVTHFLPTERAVHPTWKQRGRPCNPYFATPCEHLLRDNVRAWLFGHTHTPADFSIGPTRFVCNPRGYDDRENPLFDSQLIVEV